MAQKSAFRRLTVAVDGSPTSEAGVALSLRLAGDDTSLAFCNIVDIVSMYALAGIQADVPPVDDLRAAAEEICRDGVDEARRHGISADSVILEGQTIDAILLCAQRTDSDAIVIGSHGRTGIVRAAAGSITEELIRRSPIPVAVAHVADAVRSGPLAVALDDSAAAAGALDTAIAFARATLCELVLFHVFKPGAGRFDALGQGNRERDEEARSRAAVLLERAVERARASGVAGTGSMLEGHPANELLVALERHQCSGVVVGTHGSPELDRLLFGSVAVALVERAHIPVFVVRSSSALRRAFEAPR